MNASIITGSERIVHRHEFLDLRWRSKYSALPDLTPPIPKAFENILDILGDEFSGILQQICVLQGMRDSSTIERGGNMLDVDNRQAWIESRLYDCKRGLPQSAYLLGCCIDAAYLCAYMMFSDIWGGSLIPSHFASGLLLRLQQTENADSFSGNEGLLLWMIVIGGAFAAYDLKPAYAVLLNETYHDRLKRFLVPWSDLEPYLKKKYLVG